MKMMVIILLFHVYVIVLDAYFQLWLKGSLECSEVIVSALPNPVQYNVSPNGVLQSQLSEQEHKKNITSTVLAQLSPMCAECSNETIDNQSFSCYKESPSYLTYRARLEGTSERGSDSLVSMIEDWVGGGASIIVTGVLMTVDSHCSVVISFLSEGECSPVISSPFESISKPVLTPTKSPTTKDTTPNDSSQSSTDNTGVIIIGGVFAIVVVAITIIAIAALILKNSRATEKLVHYFLSLSLSLSLSPAHTYPLTHTHIATLSLTLSLTHTHTQTDTHTHSHTCTHTLYSDI